ncbi:unnamed protein product [Cylicocyclus nassatus]|uniref:Serpin domain-containing protein n=1 Tax=Cylicocyclus nassatus TaxID=53992 RepID=A0AA36DLV2_CYLNA|nr:unnamed protein product [Cylicocyclus nassatus]
MASIVDDNRMFLTAETDFGLNMLRQVPVSESVVFSPLSVIFALSMVRTGAHGKTKSQISELLAKGKIDDDAITEHYSNLSLQIMNAENGVQSRIANGFFLNKDFNIEKDYANEITEKFLAKVESYDFTKANETAKTINDFVSNITEGKIHDIVNADTVKDAYSLIVNAIYFTAEWEYKFYSESNKKQNFYSSENDTREIEFMNDMEEHRLYTEDDHVQVLSLQYKDTSYAFNIFLPKERFGLEELRNYLDGEKIEHLLSRVEITYISLTIPKMKIESDYKLKDALMEMGIDDMFGDEADLSGIVKSPQLKVSDAAHMAIIEVDEEGTTAAAATTVKVVPMMLIMEEPKKACKLEPRMLSKQETDFGLALLRQIPSSENAVVSPLSVLFALLMVQNGAKGKTKEQIDSIVFKGQPDHVITSYYSNFIQELSRETKVLTKIANGFFLNKLHKLRKEYQETITQKFMARIESLDFGKADETAKIINDFVNETTEGKITDLVNEAALTNAFAVIVNAVYFKGDWYYKFKAANSMPMDFHSSENNTRRIDFMNEYEVRRDYTEDDEVQFLSLHYKNTDWAFSIILPKNKFALEEFRQSLDGEKVKKLLTSTAKTYVSIAIPKMKIETDFKLKEALISMGITEMFSDDADLSGISETGGLKISKALHKAMIEVDEEGTTAAAATALVADNMAFIQREEPKEFIADHPFLFMLSKNSNPLFIGQFV